MTSGLEDDDVFYGSKKKAKKEEPQAKPYAAPPPPTTYGAPPPAQAEQPPEKDIDKEISDVRREKHMAAELHDITKLRQEAAKHSAASAKYYKKYKAEEAAMVKHTENANKARREAEHYEQKSKDATAKAEEKQSELEFLQDRKLERAKMKIAKLHAKSAKLKSKASNSLAKSAKLHAKAAAKREKAKMHHERSKMHEAESMNLTKRADRLSKA
jgi:hypothetical protein